MHKSFRSIWQLLLDLGADPFFKMTHTGRESIFTYWLHTYHSNNVTWRQAADYLFGGPWTAARKKYTAEELLQTPDPLLGHILAHIVPASSFESRCKVPQVHFLHLLIKLIRFL